MSESGAPLCNDISIIGYQSHFLSRHQTLPPHNFIWRHVPLIVLQTNHLSQRLLLAWSIKLIWLARHLLSSFNILLYLLFNKLLCHLVHRVNEILISDLSEQPYVDTSVECCNILTKYLHITDPSSRCWYHTIFWWVSHLTLMTCITSETCLFECDTSEVRLVKCYHLFPQLFHKHLHHCLLSTHQRCWANSYKDKLRG